MATYFDELMQLHPIGRGEALWKMKISWAEYEKLKEILRSQATSAFKRYEREAVLYYGEWYRREYVRGNLAKEDLCEGLGIDGSYGDDLLSAAEVGLDRLKLHVIRVNREWRKYSALYQGGLPMNRIATEIKTKEGYSNWKAFFETLVWDEVDFSKIDKNRDIPAKSTSLMEFCEALQKAAIEPDAPWNPSNCHEWWQVVVRNFDIAKRERKALNPFSFKWLIEMNDNSKEASISYQIKGPWALSQQFLAGHGMAKAPFIPFAVTVGGKTYPLAEYYTYNGVLSSRRQVCYAPRDGYVIGDEVDVVMCGEESKSLGQARSLDPSDPKLLCFEDHKRNIFTLGDQKKLASEPCRVLATVDWESRDGLRFKDFIIRGETFRVFETTPGMTHLEFVSSTGKEKILDPDVPFLWTAINDDYTLKTEVGIREKVYNADHLVFYMGRGERLVKKEVPVQYAPVGRRVWKDAPEFGWIKAVIKTDGNESVDPVTFCNVGSLEIRKVVKPTDRNPRDECRIAIDWPHGTVQAATLVLEDGSEQPIAIKEPKGVWFISKQTLGGARTAEFVFKPTGKSGATFRLNIVPPFSGFAIYDKEGRELHDNAVIPMAEIESYRYFLNEGLQIFPTADTSRNGLRYCYSNSGRNRIHISEKIASITRNERDIPFEGPLPSLFYYGSTQIDHLLENKAKTLPDAIATLRVGFDGFKVSFKEFPYKLRFEDGQVIVRNHEGLPGYFGGLLALPITDPGAAPVALVKGSRENTYLLPGEITSSQESRWLVYGEETGLVLPMMVDTAGALDEPTRKTLREETIRDIKAKLLGEGLFSAEWRRVLRWFDVVQEGRIPASSVLDLVAVADDNQLLHTFALHFFIMNSGLFKFKEEITKEDIEKGIGRWDDWRDTDAQLIDLQKQLSFLWQWAYDADSRYIIRQLFTLNAENAEMLRSFFARWMGVAGLEDRMLECLSELPKHLPECYNAVAHGFLEWMKGDDSEEGKFFPGLRAESLPPLTLLNPDTHQNGGDEILSEQAAAVFKSLRGSVLAKYGTPSQDEIWIHERRMLSEMFRSMNLSDIAEDEETKQQIRKSTIYGLKFKDYEL